jgi:hypothetical protein
MSLRIRSSRSIVASSLLVGIFLIAGCGGGTASVSGKVSYNGKPLVTGSVVVTDGTRIAYGTIGNDGSYRIVDAPAGAVKVSVGSPNPASPQVQSTADPKTGGGRDMGTKKGVPAPKPATPPVTGWFPIPEKYADPDQSGLGTTLKSGENTYNIELK